jgi:uncharacterized protein (UPF0335 family)
MALLERIEQLEKENHLLRKELRTICQRPKYSDGQNRCNVLNTCKDTTIA